MTFHHRLHGLTQIISLKSGHRMKQERFVIKKQVKRKCFTPIQIGYFLANLYRGIFIFSIMFYF